ncbi:MAG: serine protease [Christensenellaceae bacterium]|jgi:S1-C subfamily serine protease|nr:serine protease [Christensenellaceae bacterium]
MLSFIKQHKKPFIISASALLLALVIISLVLLSLAILKHKKSEIEIYDKSLYSVVELKSTTDGVGESFGTAVIFSIDDYGYLVTNAHNVSYKQLGVVKTFSKFYIQFASESEYIQVSLHKYDVEKDLAVLTFQNKPKIKHNAIKTVKKAVATGEIVYAVGNAMNQGISITKGLVSNKRVEIEYEETTKTVISAI